MDYHAPALPHVHKQAAARECRAAPTRAQGVSGITYRNLTPLHLPPPENPIRYPGYRYPGTGAARRPPARCCKISAEVRSGMELYAFLVLYVFLTRKGARTPEGGPGCARDGVWVRIGWG